MEIEMTLEQRVMRRMRSERRELQAQQMKLGRKRMRLANDAQRALRTYERAVVALREGNTPPATLASRRGVLDRTLRELEDINVRMRANAERLARLESGQELNRRVELAHSLGVQDEPLVGIDAAEALLIRRGEAMHITELTQELLEAGVVKLAGRTPSQTLSSYLTREAAKPDGRFVRVGPGTFEAAKLRQAV